MLDICYYRDPNGNFGDDMNLWMWPRIAPEIFNVGRTFPLNKKQDCRNPLFIGIGTMIDTRIPLHVPKAVIGAGAGYGNPPIIDDRWTFYSVRGPLTAKLLNLSDSLIMTDAAALLATLPVPETAKEYKHSFIPHHWSTWVTNWKPVCDMLGIHFIDPGGSVESILTDIQSSEVVIAEAMHGAIVADTYRIPWVPVRFHDHINTFKWNDWCRSLCLAYHPQTVRFPLRHHLDAPALPRKIAEKAKLAGVARCLFTAKAVEPFLSSDRIFGELLDRLTGCVEKLREDVKMGRFRA